jgi:predicted DCC family thiol-disulfide oxidoreductase YuxK
MTGGHYSVVRVATAALAWAALGVFGALPALLFGFGLFDSAAAAALSVLMMASSPGWPSDARLLAVLVLALHTALPNKPWGALATRGESDPGTHWYLPGAVRSVIWAALAAAAIHFSPWAAFALLALIGRLRPFAWLGLLGLTIVRTLLMGADDAPGWWMALMLTFEPEWLKAKVDSGTLDEVIFYDGSCGLCHGFVRFVLSEDRRGVFKFAPLQSDTFIQRIPEAQRAKLPDSVVVATASGAVLTRSAAVRHVMGRLGGLWRLGAGAVNALLPESAQDALYDAIARVRHKLFKKPSDACPLMPKELRARFLY